MDASRFFRKDTISEIVKNSSLAALDHMISDPYKVGLAFVVSIGTGVAQAYVGAIDGFVNNYMGFIPEGAPRLGAELVLHGAVLTIAKELFLDTDNAVMDWVGAFLAAVSIYGVIGTIVESIQRPAQPPATRGGGGLPAFL
jgi:hypothetical protein